MKINYSIFLFGLMVAGMVSCGGENKQQKVESFASRFAGYVNQNEMDSIEAFYPKANFDSLANLPTDEITVKENEDGTYKVTYSDDQWIEVNVGENGNITVDKSKGVVAFPEDKRELAVSTGMLTDDLNDVKAQKRMSDNDYFEWLKKKSPKNNHIVTVTPGKTVKRYFEEYEGWDARMVITVTNTSDSHISGNDYSITYKSKVWDYSHGSEFPPSYIKRGSVRGIDLGPHESERISLTKDYADNFYGFEIIPEKGKENLFTYKFTPSGNEYQEYLDSK